MTAEEFFSEMKKTRKKVILYLSESETGGYAATAIERRKYYPGAGDTLNHAIKAAADNILDLPPERAPKKSVLDRDAKFYDYRRGVAFKRSAS